MKKPILYHLSASPPVRAVLLTAKAIGLELELREINLLSGDHLTEEFKKKNPQHTIPTLEEDDDDGVVIWDSHSIIAYLVSKYAKDDRLYPKDLVIRAKIDQRMHFDSGILFANLQRTLDQILHKGLHTIPVENFKAIHESYYFLELFLHDDLFMVGNTLTVADFCTIATVSSLDGLVNIESRKFPNLFGWIKRMESLPFYKINSEGAVKLTQLVQSKMNRNQLRIN